MSPKHTKLKPKNCKERLDYLAFRRFFFGILRQGNLERLLLSYLYKKDYEEIIPIKDERISSSAFLEFMQMHQKTKLSLNEYKILIGYFDPTGDDKSLSVQGIIIMA